MKINNKKKLIIILILILILIIGSIIIYYYIDSNRTYPKYNKNDLVEVKVGRGIKENFYVISETDKEVTLVTEDILFEAPFFNKNDKCTMDKELITDTSGCIIDFEKSTLKEELEKYTKKWKHIKSIRLLTFEEVLDNVSTKENKNKLTTSTYYDFEKFLSLPDNKTGSYWLQSADPNVGYGGCVRAQEIFQTEEDKKNNLFQIKSTHKFVTEKSGVKPVITISKKYIITKK